MKFTAVCNEITGNIRVTSVRRQKDIVERDRMFTDKFDKFSRFRIRMVQWK